MSGIVNAGNIQVALNENHYFRLAGIVHKLVVGCKDGFIRFLKGKDKEGLISNRIEKSQNKWWVEQSNSGATWYLR